MTTTRAHEPSKLSLRAASHELFGDHGGLTLLRVVRLLYTARWMFVAVVTVALVFGISIALTATPMYESRVSMLIRNNPSSDGAALQRLTGVTSALGLGGVEPGLFVDPVDLAHSVAVKRELLAMRWNTERFPEPASLYRFWGLPADSSQAPRSRMKALDRLDLRISVSKRPTGLYLVIGLMEEPKLAAALADSVTRLISEKYTEIQIRKIREERRFIEEQMRQSRESLDEAEQALVQFVEANVSFRQSPQLQNHYSRLEREVTVANELYLTLRKQFQIARIEEVRAKPAFTILDAAEIPQERKSPRRLRVMIIAAMLGISAGTLAVLLLAYGSYLTGSLEAPRSTGAQGER